MATKGGLYLNNASVIGLYDQVKAYESTVQDAFYSEYKNTYKLSVSNYFRGEAADSFKNYLTNGAINIICGFLDISSDLTMIIQMFAEAFYQYENSHDGCVDEGVLDYINQTLSSKRNIFEGVKGELNAVVGLAAQYISTKNLQLGNVDLRYDDTKSSVLRIREGLYEVDDEALRAANDLYTRISDLKSLINNILGFCYRSDGKLNTDNIPNLNSQDWFETSGNVTLYLLLEEDPFEYCAGEVTLAEDQWAAGLCSDIYAYAGYSFLTASGEAGVEDGTAFAKGKAAVLNANGYAQFTDYLSAQANVNILYAEGEAKAGWSDKYKGFKVEAEVGVIQADGSVVIGSDDLNAFVKGEVKVLCADGKVAFEFEDDGEFALGVDASATAASASVKGGTTILGFKNKDTATGETETLLGFKVGAKADAGGSIAAWAESETAIETEYFNINAVTVKLDLALLVGVDMSVTFPCPWFKAPW